MKRGILLFLAIAVIVSSVVIAQQTNGNSTSVLKSTINKKPGTLTDEEIAALKTEFKDVKTGKSYSFEASFAPNTSVTPAEKKKYGKSGKVPFRITCTFYEVKEVKGKKLFDRKGGTASICIMDSEGKVVETQSKSLDKLCPSWGGTGGYFGEVAKEGEYTAVVWVKHVTGNYGSKLTIALKNSK